MSTTYIDFAPSAYAPFQFQATLDNNVYTVVVTWNLMGQRYYVNVYDLGGGWIFTLPQIGSPVDSNISITAGYFATELVYRQANAQFEVIG